MKTVGEFRKNGAKFIIGDKFICDTGAEVILNEVGIINANNGACDSWLLLDLAWRENTGVKPDFKGLVDVEFSKFLIIKSYEIDLIQFNLDDTQPVGRWRPSLSQPEKKEWPDNCRIDSIGQNGNDGLHYDNTPNQVEALAVNAPSKPVFTQAMADAGEMPPVGSEFMFSRLADPRHNDFTVCTALFNDWGVLFYRVTDSRYEGGHGFAKIGCGHFKALDTRTGKEKAIDEVIGAWPMADKSTIEVMLHMGYQKSEQEN